MKKKLLGISAVALSLFALASCGDDTATTTSAGSNIVAPTGTTGGEEKHTHNYVLYDELDSTCERDGYRIEKCEGCGDVIETVIPMKAGHDTEGFACDMCGKLNVDPAIITNMLTTIRKPITVNLSDLIIELEGVGSYEFNGTAYAYNDDLNGYTIAVTGKATGIDGALDNTLDIGFVLANGAVTLIEEENSVAFDKEGNKYVDHEQRVEVTYTEDALMVSGIAREVLDAIEANYDTLIDVMESLPVSAIDMVFDLTKTDDSYTLTLNNEKVKAILDDLKEVLFNKTIGDNLDEVLLKSLGRTAYDQLFGEAGATGFYKDKDNFKALVDPIMVTDVLDYIEDRLADAFEILHKFMPAEMSELEEENPYPSITEFIEMGDEFGGYLAMAANTLSVMLAMNESSVLEFVAEMLSEEGTELTKDDALEFIYASVYNDSEYETATPLELLLTLDNMDEDGEIDPEFDLEASILEKINGYDALKTLAGVADLKITMDKEGNVTDVECKLEDTSIEFENAKYNMSGNVAMEFEEITESPDIVFLASMYDMAIDQLFMMTDEADIIANLKKDESDVIYVYSDSRGIEINDNYFDLNSFIIKTSCNDTLVVHLEFTCENPDFDGYYYYEILSLELTVSDGMPVVKVLDKEHSHAHNWDFEHQVILEDKDGNKFEVTPCKTCDSVKLINIVDEESVYE